VLVEQEVPEARRDDGRPAVAVGVDRPDRLDHVRTVSPHDVDPPSAEQPGELEQMGVGRGNVFEAAVEPDDDDVRDGPGSSDRVTGHRLVPPRDAARRRPRSRSLPGCVERQERHAHTVRLDDERGERAGDVRSSADRIQARGGESSHGVVDRSGAGVAGVVVRDAHRVEACGAQQVGRSRRSFERVRSGRWIVRPGREGRFEIAHGDVGRGDHRTHAGEQRVRVGRA
jgi:hypothetical protein